MFPLKTSSIEDTREWVEKICVSAYLNKHVKKL